ncbi:MAG: hypothetical protein AAGF32_03730 [Pseudomonadota bacterium]
MRARCDRPHDHGSTGLRRHARRAGICAVVVSLACAVCASSGQAQTVLQAPTQLKGEALLIEDTRNVRVMAGTPDGALLLLERAKTTAADASNIIFGFAETDRTVALGAEMPFPPINPQTPIVAAFPSAATVLPDGDIIVAGTVHYSRVGPVSRERALSMSGSEKGQLAWAARLTSDGDVVWNQAYPPTAQKWDDFAYFVAPTAGNLMVIGGKTQEGGRACVDRAYGMLIWLDRETGAFSGPGRKTYTAGKTRQGFLGINHLGRGQTMAVGWAARKADEAPAQSCRDDAWALRVPATGTKPIGAGLWGSAGNDLLTGGLQISGNRFLAVGLTDVDGQENRRAIMAALATKVPLQNAMASGGVRIADTTRLTQTLQRGVPASSQGTSAAAAGGLLFGTQSSAAGTRSLRTVVYPGHGACTWTATLPTSGAAGDVRLGEVTVMGDGSISLAGRARAAGGGGKWQGFVRWASLEADEDGLVALGALEAGQSSHDLRSGTVERAATRYEFTLAAPALFNAAMHPVSGDPDLLLSRLDGAGSAGGALLAISDNGQSAAELISQVLEPGTYALTVAHPSPEVIYALKINVGAPNNTVARRAGGAGNLPNAAITKLQALGFAAPFDPNLPNRRLGAQGRAAVKAFQAQICQPVTGALSSGEVQLLTSLPAPQQP